MRKFSQKWIIIGFLASILAILFTNCGQALGPSEMDLYAENIRKQNEEYDQKHWSSLSSNQNPDLVLSLYDVTLENMSGEFYSDQLTVVMVLETEKLNDSPHFVAQSGEDFEAYKILSENNKIITEKVTSRQNQDQSLIFKTDSLENLMRSSSHLVYAVRFDLSDQVTHYLNGQRLVLPVQLNGVTVPFSFLLKTYKLSSAVKSIFVYKKSLSSGEINTVSRKLGQNFGINIPFDDSEPSAPVVPLTRFELARGVMQSSCFSCHSTWATYSESQFMSPTVNLVSKKSLENSKIYYRLKGASVSGGEVQNMPLSAGALSASDIRLIEDWILNIND